MARSCGMRRWLERLRDADDAAVAAIEELDPKASRVRLLPNAPATPFGWAYFVLVALILAAVGVLVSGQVLAVAGGLALLGGVVAFFGAPVPTTEGVVTQAHTNLARSMGAHTARAGALAVLIGLILVSVAR